MTRTRLGLAAVLCLCVPSRLPAQTDRIQNEVTYKLEDKRRLYEDIEIMRRLLNRAVPEAYGLAAEPAQGAFGFDVSRSTDPSTPGGMTYHHRKYADVHAFWLGFYGAGDTTGGPGHFHPHAFEAEGNYLKGHGVVFTMTLPTPPHDPRPEPTRAGGPTLSEWERLRRELRGERVEAAGGGPTRPRRPIADVVLKVLADNGHHFAPLGEGERLTVAITFRGQDCLACHRQVGAGGGAPGGLGPAGPGELGVGGGSPDRGAAGGAPGLPGGGGVAFGQPGGTAPAGGGTPDGAGGPPGTGGRRAASNPYVQKLMDEINNHVLLGDLHTKQRRHKEAVKVYEEAAKRYGEVEQSLALFRDTTRRDRLQTSLAESELHGKLAQAYLALGEEQKALQATQRFVEAARQAEQMAQPGPAAAPKRPAAGSMPLAAKLTISAPKALLEQAGTGKLPFADFKKAATVEYLPWAAEGSGSGPAKP